MAADDIDLDGAALPPIGGPTQAEIDGVRWRVAGGAAPPLPPTLAALGRVELHTRYERLGRSTAEIATELGVRRDDVVSALVVHDLPVRVGLDDVLTAPYLRRRYVLAGESAEQIAGSLGCDAERILAALDHHGVPLRADDEPALARRNEPLASATAPPSAPLSRSPVEAPSGVESSAPVRSRGPAAPRLTPAYLLKEYVRKGRSAASIAREWGLSSADVMRMVRDEGLPLHTVTPPPVAAAAPRAADLDRDLLEQRYLVDGLSARQIGAEAGISERAVLLRLHRLGIPLRPAGGARRVQDRLDPADLAERYRNQGQSITTIARDLDMSAESVRRALHRHGLVEPSGRATDVSSRLTLDVLRRAFVDDGRSVADIAAEHGVSTETVRRHLRLHDLTSDRSRDGHAAGVLAAVLTADVLRREYVDAGKTLAEIADQYGFSAEGVRRQLHKLEIPLRPARPGRRAPDDKPRKKPGRKTTLSEAVLQSRYVEQGQSIAEIASELRVSEEGVRQALRRNGIDLRSKRAVRVVLDPELLRARYLDDRRTLHEIAEELGVSTETVRREAHRLGIDVRRPTAPPTLTEAVLREEYETRGRSAAAIAADHDVSEQTVRRRLKQHGIALRPAGGAARHPDLADTLSAAYFQREYVLAGRTLSNIAREHDVSTETVRRYARKHGILTDRSDEAGIGDILPEPWLREHYEVLGWSITQMAENRGVSAETVRRYLHKYQIALRPVGKRLLGPGT